MDKEQAPITLLHHHAQVMIPFWLEVPHTSLWSLVHDHIIPNFKTICVDNQPAYPFLKNEDSVHILSQGLYLALVAYITHNFVEIPDVDPFTGQPNTDVICDHCGNNQNGRCAQLDED